MVNMVDNTYYQEGEIQLMIPVSDNCTFFGPNGIKFHSTYGEILIDDYIQHPKRKLFPFHDIPIHKDDKGIFVNQLFQLNKQYLAIYSIDGKYQFRIDNFFQIDGAIYVNTDVEIEMKSLKLNEMSKEKLKEKFQIVLSQNNFLCIIDDNGELHEYRKSTLDFEIPLSGIVIFGDGMKLNAYTYKLEVNNELISIKSQELNFPNIRQTNLENCSSVSEPIIHKI